MVQLCDLRTNAEGKVVMLDMQKQICFCMTNRTWHDQQSLRRVAPLMRQSSPSVSLYNTVCRFEQQWNCLVLKYEIKMFTCSEIWDSKHILAFAIVEMDRIYCVMVTLGSLQSISLRLEYNGRGFQTEPLEMDVWFGTWLYFYQYTIHKIMLAELQNWQSWPAVMPWWNQEIRQRLEMKDAGPELRHCFCVPLVFDLCIMDNASDQPESEDPRMPLKSPV